MTESIINFRRVSGSKKKDKELLQVNTENISMQTRRENALIISFKTPEKESKNIYDFFDSFDELEPILMEIEGTGDVEHYFRGISPIKSMEEEGESFEEFSVTLQLRREFL